MMTPRNPVGDAAPFLAFLLLVGGAGAMTYILLRPPPQHPEDLPRLAGCYRPLADQQGPTIRLDRGGSLSGPGFITKVIVTEDKVGLSLLPELQVSWSDAAPHVVLAGGSPLKLRLNPDGNSFEMLGDKDIVTFRRSGC